MMFNDKNKNYRDVKLNLLTNEGQLICQLDTNLKYQGDQDLPEFNVVLNTKGIHVGFDTEQKNLLEIEFNKTIEEIKNNN